jgi:hypothetical protein
MCLVGLLVLTISEIYSDSTSPVSNGRNYKYRETIQNLVTSIAQFSTLRTIVCSFSVVSTRNNVLATSLSTLSRSDNGLWFQLIKAKIYSKGGTGTVHRWFRAEKRCLYLEAVMKNKGMI